MMGTKTRSFSPLPRDVSLEELVPEGHFYRRLEALEARLDLSFVRDLVRPLYARGGRPSVDPVVFFKLQIVLFCEDLRSEQQIMEIVAERLSIRWYLGYDLHEPLPDHSTGPRRHPHRARQDHLPPRLQRPLRRRRREGARHPLRPRRARRRQGQPAHARPPLEDLLPMEIASPPRHGRLHLRQPGEHKGHGGRGHSDLRAGEGLDPQRLGCYGLTATSFYVWPAPTCCLLCSCGSDALLLSRRLAPIGGMLGTGGSPGD